MPEYAEVRQGMIKGFRMVREVLDPATIRKEGGQLYLVAVDQTQTAITEDDLPRVIAPYRIRHVGPLLYLDGEEVDALPPGSLVGTVIRIGGTPVLLPVREVKPVFNPASEELANQGEVIGVDEVVRTYVVVARRYRIPKAVIVERLINAGKASAIVTAVGADPARRLRWESIQDVPHDNPMVIQLLQAVGADPAVILAPVD